MFRSLTLFGFIALSACAVSDSYDVAGSSFIVASVERDVSTSEVAGAVERLVRQAPVCIPIPPLWWEHHNPLTVRFGPPSWRGRAIPADAEQRVRDLAQMGFWTAQDVSIGSDRLLELTLTPFGERSLEGNYSYSEGAFCAPAERRVLRIVESVRVPAERSDRRYEGFIFYPPESLSVTFEWIGVDSPSWLSTPALRERYHSLLPASDRSAMGWVRLFRVWSRSEHPLENAPHSGALAPYCYDSVHDRPIRCGPVFR